MNVLAMTKKYVR